VHVLCVTHVVFRSRPRPEVRDRPSSRRAHAPADRVTTERYLFELLEAAGLVPTPVPGRCQMWQLLMEAIRMSGMNFARGIEMLNGLLSSETALHAMTIGPGVLSPWGRDGPAIYRRYMTDQGQWQAIMEAAHRAAQAGMFMRSDSALGRTRRLSEHGTGHSAWTHSGTNESAPSARPESWQRLASTTSTARACEAMNTALLETLVEVAYFAPTSAAAEAQVLAMFVRTRNGSC